MSRTDAVIRHTKKELAAAKRDYESADGRVRDAEAALNEARIWRSRCAIEVEGLTDLITRLEGTS